MVFDGSDVGLTGNVDAFFFEDDGSLLLSLAAAATLPGPGAVADADLLRFTPAQLGETTAGSFTLLLDGSDVGLDSVNENIDAIGRTPDGRLLVSVSGSFSAGEANGGDEDLFVFAAESLGDVTAGSWSLYFDGSDIGLATGSSEDIDGVWVDPAAGYLYLGTAGDFAAGAGMGGDKNDIFVCAPASPGEQTDCDLGPFWGGGYHGLEGGSLRPFALAPATAPAGLGRRGQEPGTGFSPARSLHLPYIAAP